MARGAQFLTGRKLPVRVHRGGLSGKYFAITNYKVIDAERDLIEARTKHDVTADVEALIAERVGEICQRYLKAAVAEARERGADTPTLTTDNFTAWGLMDAYAEADVAQDDWVRSAVSS